MEKLVNKILQGDKRSAAKAISMIENQDRQKNQLIHLLYRHTGQAKTIGITGPPGAGKSTLVDQLIKQLRRKNLKVAVIAVDPSSPYTGGALLGDRVRMQQHATDPGVFIRSMGSRGTLGGLARATNEAIRVLDAMGSDIILIETVGVGQSELEIINIADTTVVVLHPGGGDSIQAFKAGIMEIADIFVINKSDLAGAQKMLHEIEMLLDMTKQQAEWKTPIIKTVSTESQGIDQLWDQISLHLQYVKKTGIIAKKRDQALEKELRSLLHDLFQEQLEPILNSEGFKALKEQIKKREATPIQIAEKIYQQHFFHQED